MSLLDTIPMAGDTWLDFYHLFQKIFVCGFSDGYGRKYNFAEDRRKRQWKKICGTQT